MGILYLSNTRGDNSRTAKLTAAAVLAMRQERAAGVPVRELAERYGIRSSYVGVICRGLSWPHVGGPRTARSVSR